MFCCLNHTSRVKSKFAPSMMILFPFRHYSCTLMLFITAASGGSGGSPSVDCAHESDGRSHLLLLCAPIVRPLLHCHRVAREVAAGGGAG